MQIPVSSHFASSDVLRRGGASRSEEERGGGARRSEEERGGRKEEGREGGATKKQDLHRGVRKKVICVFFDEVWCCLYAVFDATCYCGEHLKFVCSLDL